MGGRQGVVQVIDTERNHSAFEFVGESAVVGEVARRTGRFPAGITDPLAIVQAFGPGNFIPRNFELRGDPEHEGHALLRPHVCHTALIRAESRSVDGGIDIAGLGQRDFCERLCGGRILDVDPLAGNAIDPFAAYVVTPERSQGWSGRYHCSHFGESFAGGESEVMPSFAWANNHCQNAPT